MSGQTYSTTIHIPTPRELAQQVAARARKQRVAGASGFEGAGTAITRLRAQALRHMVDTIAPIGAPVAGTARACGPASAQVEVAVRGARVPFRLDVDPAAPQAGRLTLAFDHAHGLTCADEGRIAAEVAALFARSAVRTPDGGAAATAPPDATSEAGR